MVEWIAEYLDGGNREYPVLAQVEPGDVAAQLPDEMPTVGEDPEAVWQDFLDIVLPGVTHWNHPGFMAYFGITGSGPGVLGEMPTVAHSARISSLDLKRGPSAVGFIVRYHSSHTAPGMRPLRGQKSFP